MAVPQPTKGDYFLKKPQLRSYNEVIKYMEEVVHAQHRGYISVDRHRVVNSSCQIVLKALELKGNMATIEQLAERIDVLEKNPKKGRKKKKMQCSKIPRINEIESARG